MLIGTYTTLYDSPITPWSTLVTLLIVLSISMTKEAVEDTKRHKADRQTNEQTALVLTKYGGDGDVDGFRATRWRDVRVGNLVKIPNNHEMPADVVLLMTSEPSGAAYIETSNIDGKFHCNSCDALGLYSLFASRRDEPQAEEFLPHRH